MHSQETKNACQHHNHQVRDITAKAFAFLRMSITVIIANTRFNAEPAPAIAFLHIEMDERIIRRSELQLKGEYGGSYLADHHIGFLCKRHEVFVYHFVVPVHGSELNAFVRLHGHGFVEQAAVDEHAHIVGIIAFNRHLCNAVVPSVQYEDPVVGSDEDGKEFIGVIIVAGDVPEPHSLGQVDLFEQRALL